MDNQTATVLVILLTVYTIAVLVVARRIGNVMDRDYPDVGDDNGDVSESE